VEAKTLLDGANPPALIDLRTREEHDAVSLPGSLFFTEDLQREAFATWDKNRAIILYDHMGNRSLDMAAWFAGHGLHATRALSGGIDAWSREVDRAVPRYRIEMET
jgi:rhodanese-related sulfurtransferase